jgi:hypothetical protein
MLLGSRRLLAADAAMVARRNDIQAIVAGRVIVHTPCFFEAIAVRHRFRFFT